MINKIIRNYIAKRIAGRSDDGIMITLKDPQRVTLGENIMADLLMRNGINPVEITSEAQLKAILQQIENAEAAAIRNTGIRNTESAKVFNIEGQKLDPNKPIIGGTQTGKELSPELSERLRGTNTERIKQKIADKKIDDDLPPPGSRGGPDDIAAPIQSAEESLKDMTEAEIKKNIEAQNKKGIENILKRKNRKDVYGLEDYDTTNMSDIKKEIIRTETKLGNLNPDDPGFREKAKPLVDKITELQKKLRDDKADGGIMRIGLKEGLTPGQQGPMGPVYTTNKIEDAAKEVIKRLVRIDDAKIPLDDKLSIALRGLDGATIEGVMEILGGQLSFSAGKEGSDKGIGFNFYKQFADGGRIGLKEGTGMNRRTFLKFLAGATSKSKSSGPVCLPTGPDSATSNSAAGFGAPSSGKGFLYCS